MPTINLHLGDCMEAMRAMPDNAFQLAIVDPPYGIDNQRMGGRNGYGFKSHTVKNWDKQTPGKDYFEQLFRVSENQIIWGANYFPQMLSPSMGWLVWDKLQRNFSFSEAEFAYTSFQCKSRVFQRFTALDATQERIHPTQKPIDLYKWLLKNYAKPGDKILDTHLGSGSIAIACHDMGFDLEAYEIDPDYHAAALKRFERHKAQLSLFAA